MLYNVREITGEYAIDGGDGLQLYSQIYPELSTGRDVELNFDGVKVFASIFFNFGLGQLLRDLVPETLNQHLTIKNLSTEGQVILDEVIKNAKLYYSDLGYREAVDIVMKEFATSC
jgi:hypothetical protein